MGTESLLRRIFLQRCSHWPEKQSLFKVQKAVDEGELSCGLFLDFSKAFDTEYHDILIDKLEYYEIRGFGKDLITSYLKNHKQMVAVDSVTSDLVTDPCGIFPKDHYLVQFYFYYILMTFINVQAFIYVYLSSHGQIFEYLLQQLGNDQLRSEKQKKIGGHRARFRNNWYEIKTAVFIEILTVDSI